MNDNAPCATLIELAEARFHLWHRQTLRPERERRTRELEHEHRDVRKLAIHLLRLERELLEEEIQQRIAYYFSVAQKEGRSSGMLSAGRLAELKNRIDRSVNTATASFRGRLRRRAHAVGLPDSALPHDRRFVHLQAEILDAVDNQLRVLAAEGNLAEQKSEHQAPAPASRLASGTRADDSTITGERASFRAESDAWRHRRGLKVHEAAKSLGISLSTFKSMRSPKGARRFSQETRSSVLSKIRADSK